MGLLVTLPEGTKVASRLYHGAANATYAYVDWPPDGRQVLMNDELWDAATGSVRLPLLSNGQKTFEVWAADAPQASWQWTRDGARLFVQNDDKLFCIDRNTGRALWERSGVLGKIALSPRGGALAFVAPDGALQLLRPDTIEVDTIAQNLVVAERPPRFRNAELEFSEDGQLLALRGSDGRAHVCDLASRRCESLPVNQGWMERLQWRGRDFYAMTSSRFLGWSPEPRRRWILDLPAGASDLVDFEVSPDGRFVLVAANATLFLVRLVDRHVVTLQAKPTDTGFVGVVTPPARNLLAGPGGSGG